LWRWFWFGVPGLSTYSGFWFGGSGSAALWGALPLLSLSLLLGGSGITRPSSRSNEEIEEGFGSKLEIGINGCKSFRVEGYGSEEGGEEKRGSFDERRTVCVEVFGTVMCFIWSFW
jgi:hypothetical protein